MPLDYPTPTARPPHAAVTGNVDSADTPGRAVTQDRALAGATALARTLCARAGRARRAASRRAGRAIFGSGQDDCMRF
jgi:hypothetical protein